MQISSRNLYEHYSPSQDYVCPALTKPSADLYVNLQSELHANQHLSQKMQIRQ